MSVRIVIAAGEDTGGTVHLEYADVQNWRADDDVILVPECIETAPPGRRRLSLRVQAARPTVGHARRSIVLVSTDRLRDEGCRRREIRPLNGVNSVMT
ncbi:hypothetical protein [Natronorarus salvus]|uniref:hypothetical protein n=1 Tax=Natronorarus salvus TaxID=3117733 RepID=UPI002F267174